MDMNSTATKTTRPLHPWLVLTVAALLPGMGQVVNRTPQRGLVMVFFLIFFAMTSYQLTTPEHSWLARHAGGVFMYGFMLIDAYRFAKIRHAHFHRGHAESKNSGNVSQH